jgi:hypothetical protein
VGLKIVQDQYDEHSKESKPTYDRPAASISTSVKIITSLYIVVVPSEV